MGGTIKLGGGIIEEPIADGNTAFDSASLVELLAIQRSSPQLKIGEGLFQQTH